MFLCPFICSKLAGHGLIAISLHKLIFFKHRESFRVQLQVPFVMEIIILMGWSIGRPEMEDTKKRFQSEFALILLRAERRASLRLNNG